MNEGWVVVQQKVVQHAFKSTKAGDRGRRTGFLDGLNLIALLEILSSKSLGHYNKNPKMRIQKISNLSSCFKFLEAESIKVVGMGAEDVADANLKLTLGLIWTLILRFQISQGSTESKKSPNNALLEWVRSKIPQHDIKNFNRDWQSGTALYDLVNAVKPDALPVCNSDDPMNVCKQAMECASLKMDIPMLLDPEDMVESPDDHSNMTYISYFRMYDNIPKPETIPGNHSISANVLGEYVRVDFSLDSSYNASTDDYLTIAVPGSSLRKCIMKIEAGGDNEGAQFFECEDDIPKLINRVIVVRYVNVDGVLVVESEKMILEFAEYTTLATLDGKSLQANFYDEEGEMIHSANVMDHQEYFVQSNSDANEDDTEGDDDFSFINARYRKSSSLISGDYKVPADHQVSKRDYIAISLANCDEDEYVTCKDARGKSEGRFKVDIDGFESELRGKKVVARYYSKNGDLLLESDSFKVPRK